MPVEITSYKCAYCNKVSRTKGSIVQHEKWCRHNPQNRYCHTCANCDPNGVILTVDTCTLIDPHDTIEVRGMYCTHYEMAINKDTAPYYIECDTADNAGWGPEEKVPCTCQAYEAKKEDAPQR